jgi:hypothetical protein
LIFQASIEHKRDKKMAAGDSKIFNDFGLKLGKKAYDLSSDAFAISFVADTYASIDADATDPNISGFTPLVGGNFVAATTLTSVTWTRTSGVSKFDYADLTTIAKNASNPATIRCALIKHTASGDLYKAIDLTSDGTTAIDVVNNDFDYTVNAGGSSTLTVA